MRGIGEAVRGRFPDLKIIVGLWTTLGFGGKRRPKKRHGIERDHLVVASLAGAVEQVRKTVAHAEW